MPASSVTISATRPSLVSATRATAPTASTTSATPATRASQRKSARRREQVDPQAAHAAQPAVVVVRLPAEVLGDLGMGKDQETLGGDALDDLLRDCLWLESPLGQEIRAQLFAFGREHVGLHALRAEAGNQDARIAMDDREPLEEREGCGLRHSIRCG